MVSGQALVATAAVVLNQQPIVQSGIYASVDVMTADGSAVDVNSFADGIWVLLGDDVWESGVLIYDGTRTPSSFNLKATGGPKWGADGSTFVDVVVRVRDATATPRLVRVANVRIVVVS
jgi:hypothetical protein